MTDATELRIRVHPRARTTEVAGLRDGVLHIRVTAPPADGKANEAVRRLIAKQAAVGPSAVTIVRGARARDKTIRIEGATDDDLRRAGLRA